jgi:SAM-dependent methyltransferase
MVTNATKKLIIIMNKQSQELIFNNLICPFSKENLVLENQKLDTNGLIEFADLLEKSTRKYSINNGCIDFVSIQGAKQEVIYSLEKQSYVDKLIKNGWTYDNISKMDSLRNNINNLLDFYINKFAKGFVLEVGSGGSYLKDRYYGSIENWITSDYDIRAKVDIRCDGQSLPFTNNLFDTIICIDVIEHVPNPQQMIAELVRVLKPGGVLILSTPFFFYLHESPNDYTRFSKFGLINLIQNNKMSVIDLKPTGGIVATIGILVTASIVHVFYRFKFLCNFLLFINKYLQKLLEPIDLFINKNEKFSQGNFIISKK